MSILRLSEDEQHHLAMHEHLTEEEQLELAESPYDSVVEALAGNPNLTRSAAFKLAENKYNWYWLLHQKDLPGEVLEDIYVRNENDVNYDFLVQHPNSTKYMKQMELARLQNEPEVPDGEYYDPAAWSRGQATGIESALWRRHEDYGRQYMREEPDPAQLQDSFLLELWSASLSFTPDFVLDRITKKLAPRLATRRFLESEYAHVPTVGADLEATDDSKLVAEPLLAVASHPNTSAASLRMLASTKHAAICSRVALSSKTSLPVLKNMLDVPGVHTSVAQHPNKNIQKLFPTLLARRDESVLVALAKNPYLRSIDLEKLETTSDNTPRLAGLGSNPTYFPRRLQELASSASAAIRAGVASNPAINPTLQAELAEDHDTQVLSELAANPKVDPEILRKLRDCSPAIRTALAANPATPEDVLRSMVDDDTLRLALAQNPQVPHDVQSFLASDPDHQISRRLAANPGAAAHVLQQLATRNDADTHWLIVNHDAVTSDTLQELQKHSPSTYVRLAASRRQLLHNGDADHPGIKETAARIFAEHMTE